MKPIILITGATAGIGEACAVKFAAHGWNLVLTGRRKDRLEALENRLRNQFGAESKTLCFDVRNRKAVEDALNGLGDNWKRPAVLLNNAGLALGRSPFQTGEVEDWDTMIDTNVKGLLYVSRVVSPWMITAGNGHIINLGSVAGKEIYPEGNVYCASKFAVDALSKSMRADLVSHNIRVTQVCPGMVDTEFSMVRFKGDEQKAKGVYKGIQPLVASDIADIIYYAATLPAHVCLNDIVVTCTAQANATTFFRK